MDVESEAGFTEIGFTVGRCASCDREVLTYPAIEPDDDDVHCVHCDATVTDDVRTTAGANLPDHGYGLLELQGCGSPDCGGGACGRMSQAAADGAANDAATD